MATHQAGGVVRLTPFDVSADQFARLLRVQTGFFAQLLKGLSLLSRTCGTEAAAWPVRAAERVDQPLRPLLGLRAAQAESPAPPAQARRRIKVEALFGSQGGQGFGQDA